MCTNVARRLPEFFPWLPPRVCLNLIHWLFFLGGGGHSASLPLSDMSMILRESLPFIMKLILVVSTNFMKCTCSGCKALPTDVHVFPVQKWPKNRNFPPKHPSINFWLGILQKLFLSNEMIE